MGKTKEEIITENPLKALRSDLPLYASVNDFHTHILFGKGCSLERLTKNRISNAYSYLHEIWNSETPSMLSNYKLGPQDKQRIIAHVRAHVQSAYDY